MNGIWRTKDFKIFTGASSGSTFTSQSYSHVRALGGICKPFALEMSGQTEGNAHVMVRNDDHHSCRWRYSY